MIPDTSYADSWLEEPETSPGCTVGPRAVVADNDPCLRHLIACLLAAEGLFVTEVSDASGLVQAAAARCCTETDPFDLIVADLPLPGSNEFEPLERVRQAGCWSPVIVIADHLDENESAQLKRLHVGHLAKPFDQRNLRALANRIRLAYDDARGQAACLR
jgi:CheY-like chemotaxis protein